MNEDIDGSSLGVSLGTLVLSEIGVSDELLDGSEYGNLVVSALGGSLGSEIGAEVGYSEGMLDRKGDEKLEVSLVGLIVRDTKLRVTLVT